VANLLFREGKTSSDGDAASAFIRLATSVVTCVVEMGVDDPQLYRIAAYVLDSFDQVTLAATLFEKVLVLRPSQPQSHRDLALVLARRGEQHVGVEGQRDVRQAVRLLGQVVSGKWDCRYDEIELTARMELANLVTRPSPLREAAAAEWAGTALANTITLQALPCTLRISLAWDTDDTDIDLHVLEPGGEKCYYGHKCTSAGGLLSRDFTRGFGPEEYMIRDGEEGEYAVTAKYYSSSRQDLAGATTLMLTSFTDWGGVNERRQRVTVRLAKNEDIVEVGSVHVGEGGRNPIDITVAMS
jgi:hypothetical protein